MKNLEGKIVIVTGGAGLLGSQFMQAILEINGSPISLDIRPCHKFLSPTSEFICDITNEIEVEETLKKILVALDGRPIYGLINNASINPKFDENKPNFFNIEDYPLEKWYEEVETGLTGSLICTKVFGREMIKHNQGVIINISSYLGIMSPNQNFYEKLGTVKPLGYTIIKHAMIGLTKHTATEWAKHNIRCNTLAPHGVYNNQSEEFVTEYIKQIPLGRMAEPNEYNEAIKFLLTDSSKYMTGHTLIMDGGHSIW